MFNLLFLEQANKAKFNEMINCIKMKNLSLPLGVKSRQ